MALDARDKRILYELDLNSKQSFKQLAKRVGLSKEVAAYRTNKLVEEGIIRDFYARVDFASLGCVVFRTFLRLYNLSPTSREEIITEIVSNKKVGWCVLIDGAWDINFMYYADSISDYEEFFRNFTAKFGNQLEQKWISLYGRYTNYPKTFFVRDKRSENEKGFILGNGKKAELDEKDRQILSLLSKNSRTEQIEIAKKVGLNPKTVSEKIKQFEKNKIISGYGISLNLEKIGYLYYKLHLNFKKFDKKIFESLKEYVRRNANIIYTNELINGADFEMDIYVENISKYHKILDEIRYQFSDVIKSFETMQYYKELKHNLLPS